MKTTTVFNMRTGEEQTYSDVNPYEALISAAIIDAKETTNLTNPLTRDRYRAKILHGMRSASCGDVAIDTRYI